jgi:hypothetical protein
LKKKDRFKAACQSSVKATLGDLYRSRGEEAKILLESKDRRTTNRRPVGQLNDIAKSWANQIGANLQGVIEDLYVELKDTLDDNEVS